MWEHDTPEPQLRHHVVACVNPQCCAGAVNQTIADLRVLASLLNFITVAMFVLGANFLLLSGLHFKLDDMRVQFDVVMLILVGVLTAAVILCAFTYTATSK
jgi:uncharacterized membrane protein (GlpM family)